MAIANGMHECDGVRMRVPEGQGGSLGGITRIRADRRGVRHHQGQSEMTDDNISTTPESLLASEGPPVRRVQRPQRPVARGRASGVTWQAEKSLATRSQILDATLQCRVELGYTQTTTEKIAQKASMSRGAMTHHFKSRVDVFNAAAEYITDLRAAEYEDAAKRIKLPAGNTPTFESCSRRSRCCRSTTTAGRPSSRCRNCSAARAPTGSCRACFSRSSRRWTKGSRRRC
jgi:hypothetical protein